MEILVDRDTHFIYIKVELQEKIKKKILETVSGKSLVYPDFSPLLIIVICKYFILYMYML